MFLYLYECINKCIPKNNIFYLFQLILEIRVINKDVCYTSAFILN